MNVIKSSNGSNHMNVRHFVPSVSRRLLSMGSLILAASLHYASGEDLSKYKRIEPQFIAALGDPGATSGNGARSEEHTSELQSPYDLVCRLLLEKKKELYNARRSRQGPRTLRRLYSASTPPSR